MLQVNQPIFRPLLEKFITDIMNTTKDIMRIVPMIIMYKREYI